MFKYPTVSVIIPTYNRALYITSALDSVFAQNYNNFEVIVVDDGSTDNTREVLRKYFKKIVYIYQENSGVSSARNRGIRRSQGEWLAFLDSDDEWHPDKLSTQIKRILKDDKLCVHTTNASLLAAGEHPKNNMKLTGFLSNKVKTDYIDRPLKYQIKFGLSRIQCSLIRRNELLKAGLFDPKLTMFEDQDLMCRLALKGRWGVSTRELVYIYRRDEKIKNLSQQRIFNRISSYEGLVYLYEKLRKIPNLLPKEKQLVIKTLCACKASLGMELLKIKNKSMAQRIFRQALFDSPTLKSFFRYSISFLPIHFSHQLVSIWQKFYLNIK